MKLPDAKIDGALAAKPVETAAIPGLDRSISRIGFGGWAVGGHGWGVNDDQQAVAAVRAAADAGITFFDTADVYGLGHSEELIREALGTRRHHMVIATKGGVKWDAEKRIHKDSTPGHLTSAAEASLTRLGLESIPLYYLHWKDGQTPLEESVAALVRLREQGKIQTFGLCNIDADELRQMASAGVAAVQVKGNLLEPGTIQALAKTASETGVPLIPYSSLADGLLTGKFNAGSRFGPDDHRSRYPLFQPAIWGEVLERVEILVEESRRLGRSPAQVAVRWLLDCPMVGAALCGAKDPRQVQEQTGALGWSLSPDIHAALCRRISYPSEPAKS